MYIYQYTYLSQIDRFLDVDDMHMYAFIDECTHKVTQTQTGTHIHPYKQERERSGKDRERSRH